MSRVSKYKNPLQRVLYRSTYDHIFFGYVHGYVMGAAESIGMEEKPGEPGGPYGAIKEAITSFYHLAGERCTDQHIDTARKRYLTIRREFEIIKTELYGSCNQERSEKDL